MIDTHAHLNFPQLANRIDGIIAESRASGLLGIIIASSNIKDSLAAVDLAKKYPGFLYASVGIHPQNTDPENNTSIEDQLNELDTLISTSRLSPITSYSPIVAIGETGLDFSPAPEGEKDRTKEEQEILFKGQIKLAQKYNLPLVIHAREAVDEVISILSGLSNLRGTFHCYAGGKKRIQKILDLDSHFPALPAGRSPLTSHSPGWYFGFDGNITYDEGLQNILSLIPKDRIIIETDSPFLAPVPHRGETNTPVFLPFIQQKINEILKEDLTEQIFSNTKNLFGLQI